MDSHHHKLSLPTEDFYQARSYSCINPDIAELAYSLDLVPKLK